MSYQYFIQEDAYSGNKEIRLNEIWYAILPNNINVTEVKIIQITQNTVLLELIDKYVQGVKRRYINPNYYKSISKPLFIEKAE